MDLDAVDVGRFEVGRFGDLRLQKRGPGVIRHWWLRRGLAFWLCRMAGGAARSVSGEWGKIFQVHAMTLAAIDRLVHHATIIEMNVESYRRREAIERTRGRGRPSVHATIKNTDSDDDGSD